MLRPSTVFQLALLLAVAATGCRREIGDECMTAVDCNPNGSRSCDGTQPGGYCTIQGCDELSCPEEAVCMRYFPAQFLTKPCRPHDHVVDPNAPTDPNASIDPNAPTGCDADEVCLDAGLCAPLSTELRYCVKSCASVDDCREGYECRLAGTRGSMALTRDPTAVVNFCAPR